MAKRKPKEGSKAEEAAETKAQESSEMQRYQAEDDVRTLSRAHEIKKDPKRHSRAKAHAKSQLEAMQQVASGGDGSKGAVPAPAASKSPY